jgi:DNA polymerase III delta prime subunit
LACSITARFTRIHIILFLFYSLLQLCQADFRFYSVSVLVLNDVDKLSREAQHSLRRTMEKYSAYCRLVLCCNSSSRVTEAIRSRCLNVRINAPSEEQVNRFEVFCSVQGNNGICFLCFGIFFPLVF